VETTIELQLSTVSVVSTLGPTRRVQTAAMKAINLLFAAIALLAAAVTSAQPLQADTPIEAVWKVQRMNFAYRGYSTLYTCQSLQTKLEKILLVLGARGGIELRAYSCDDESAVASFQITLESPVAATPENVQELTTHDANAVLRARMRGQRLATAEDLPRFPAVWKTISFVRDQRMKLTPADCELVQQLSRHILPRMSVQIVRDKVHCSPFGNIGRPQLTVSALVPL